MSTSSRVWMTQQSQTVTEDLEDAWGGAHVQFTWKGEWSCDPMTAMNHNHGSSNKVDEMSVRQVGKNQKPFLCTSLYLSKHQKVLPTFGVGNLILNKVIKKIPYRFFCKFSISWFHIYSYWQPRKLIITLFKPGWS